MKITDIYNLEDVMDCGPFEGETLYNKAYKYGRHDICLKIAETKRETADFEENVRKYEETGEQQYKDKATGRYYHMVLWEEIIRRLREKSDVPLYVPRLKEIIIDELGFPKPYNYSCFACIATCETCPIAERAGRCMDENSTYDKFTTALSRGDIEAAIKYAEVMADAWIR